MVYSLLNKMSKFTQSFGPLQAYADKMINPLFLLYYFYVHATDAETSPDACLL